MSDKEAIEIAAKKYPNYPWRTAYPVIDGVTYIVIGYSFEVLALVDIDGSDLYRRQP